jgi:hypothetical protein
MRPLRLPKTTSDRTNAFGRLSALLLQMTWNPSWALDFVGGGLAEHIFGTEILIGINPITGKFTYLGDATVRTMNFMQCISASAKGTFILKGPENYR